MQLTINKRKKEIDILNKFDLSLWELVFWENNPIKVNKESEIKDVLQKEIEKKLNTLYNYTNKPEIFYISPNSKELERELDIIISKHKKQDEEEIAKDIENNRTKYLENLALEKSSKIFEDYNNLVENLKVSKYPDAFCSVILDEALKNIYKTLVVDDEVKVVTEKRILDKSVAPIMNLPFPVLDYIFFNAGDYTDFKQLYTHAQSIFVNSALGENLIANIDSKNTSNKGYWLCFPQKCKDEENFNLNVAKIKALTIDTPWCSTRNAVDHLTKGDYYFFVDNTKNHKPHIAVLMYGDSIFEIRGILYENGQELESDYRDVAIEFLKNNINLKDADKWLQKEERMKRLVDFENQIKNGTFKKEDTKKLLKDLSIPDYNAHLGVNKTLMRVKKSCKAIAPYIAEELGVLEEEIAFGNTILTERCPYKVVLGDFRVPQPQEAPNATLAAKKLKMIFGRVFASGSVDADLPNLEVICGDAFFVNSGIKNLDKLSYIGGDALFSNSNIYSLFDLKYIGGNVISNTTNFDSLIFVGKNADFSDAKNRYLNITHIGGDLLINESEIEEITTKYIGRNFNAQGSKLTNADDLENVEGDMLLDDTPIRMLYSIKNVGGKMDRKAQDLFCKAQSNVKNLTP